MKNVIFCIIAQLIIITGYAQGIAINNTGSYADSSAILDVTSVDLGLLIPRIALADTSDATTIPSPAYSLIIFNTGTGGGLTEGYYYNDGTGLSPHWVQLTSNPMNQNFNMAGSKIINLATCTDDNDAANKAYVDAQVAGGGGGSGYTRPTMLSDESSTNMYFHDAQVYCRNLTEGGYTDWFMPSYEELVYVVSFTPYSIPNESSTNTFWSGTPDSQYGEYYLCYNFSYGQIIRYVGSDQKRARCVR